MSAGLDASIRRLLGVAAGLILVWSASPASAADCGSMPTAGIDWSQCNKKNLMLEGNDFQGANLADADLTLTNLSGTNLNGANFEKATLVRAWFTNAQAAKANFAKIEAYRSGFDGVVADGASFIGAELQRANFHAAKLSGANFEKAELGRANFKEAVLTGAKFSLANLSRADFTTAQFEGPLAFDGAFMFLTRINGLDLSAATGLEQAQVDLTCGDSNTKLPAGLSTPKSWPCDSD
ncbi:pentapeptide repeat-containing protein [Rhizobium sp. S152]|uniref:pentapeptide repeat-containing protein n=1 Tax=Rhizobium sp. S152 TaxID=3055038 RepID=UPI0025A9C77F|nr:pentapeptide repeat-containing protein [Rhizobium sp. S152]MDM9629704.1 pentapeptide repeat-containing protein [Rhizobium sp. S152]